VVWIEDEHPIDARYVASKCRALAARGGLSLVVVDYLQLVSPAVAGKRDSSREREVAEISRALKSLALELNVVVLALSQLNDAGQLRESRAIGQDADIVLHIAGEDDGKPERIEIQKHRNGPRCQVPVNFDGRFMRFSDSRFQD
jgi:replicative DNA helicase